MPSSARGRRHHDVSHSRDPLTALFFFFVYPIFFFLFIILHTLYYLFLKLIASIQWQRYIYSQARQQPTQLFHTWKEGLGLRKAGAYTAQKRSEERLLKRGNRIRDISRVLVEEEQDTMGVKTKKQRMLAPRHLALVLATKPIRVRVLLFRLVLSFLQSKKAVSAASEGRNSGGGTRNRKEEERQSIEFLMESVETALKCCALTGVEEISIYDEEGRIKNELLSRGHHEWTLEWPLEHEWEGPIEEDIPTYEFKTPRSDSFTSTTNSFTSALDSTPTLSTKPSSTSLDTLGIRSDLNNLLASSSPRLRLSASLHTPFQSSRTNLNGCSRSRTNGFPSIDNNVSHAKIKINLLGPEDGKGALAKAASILKSSESRPKIIDVKAVDSTLQSQGYPSEPELLIIHGGPRRVRTLHGFPPWLVRLCEIYYDQTASPYHPLSSSSFEGAIASFSRSEQRYGK